MKTKPLDAALAILAQREHGEAELKEKLLRKGYTLEESAQAIAACQDLGMQSDARFVDMLCRTRIRQGYGPQKIQQELLAKKINKECIQEALQKETENWIFHAQAVWNKKWKRQPIQQGADLQKKQRFLLYRGFPMHIIAEVVDLIKADEQVIQYDEKF